MNVTCRPLVLVHSPTDEVLEADEVLEVQEGVAEEVGLDLEEGTSREDGLGRRVQLVVRLLVRAAQLSVNVEDN